MVGRQFNCSSMTIGRARLSAPNGTRERAELGDCELLGARGWGDPGALEERLDWDAQRLEAGPQHLATLAERCGGNVFEYTFLRWSEWLGSRHNTNNARRHVRGRDKGASGYVEKEPRLCEPLGHYREPSVRLAVRRRSQTLRNLALEHQRQAFVFVNAIEPAEQQRGRDVVGEIGNNFAR